jgi:integrase
MRANKPEKPRPDFPLTAHPAGVWVKKIKGKIHSFGGWANPDAALRKYLDQKVYLEAGMTPPDPAAKKITMSQLVDLFLDSKQTEVTVKGISRSTFCEHQKSCKRILGIVGKNAIVEALSQANFDQYAAKISDGIGLVTFANRIRLALVLFRYASEADLIPKKLKFGNNFKLPSKMAMRAERQKRPTKDYTAAQIRLLVDSATPILKAMIMLGINCAFGSTDCASLTSAHIDLDAGWVSLPRPKTAIERRCPLWPETITALRIAIPLRPPSANEEFGDLLFLTRSGRPYIRSNRDGSTKDMVGDVFRKVLTKLNLKGNFRAFYGLRRTFETIGGDARDQIPVDHIMGHSPPDDDMSAVYRQHISDDRLIAVTNHVRSWLGYPEDKSDPN